MRKLVLGGTGRAMFDLRHHLGRGQAGAVGVQASTLYTHTSSSSRAEARTDQISREMLLGTDGSAPQDDPACVTTTLCLWLSKIVSLAQRLISGLLGKIKLALGDVRYNRWRKVPLWKHQHEKTKIFWKAYIIGEAKHKGWRHTQSGAEARKTFLLRVLLGFVGHTVTTAQATITVPMQPQAIYTCTGLAVFQPNCMCTHPNLNFV